ncbi:MAG: anaerobic ribonucleoside-triphosphate reductase, partial [bacterium]
MSNKITQVRKRDDSIIDFDKTRIENAVFKALTVTTKGDGRRSKRIASRVVRIINRRFKKGDIPNVEQIQDIVEEVLILEGLVEAARAYILYREQRRRIREATSLFDESTEAVDKYLKELDWQVNENANMAYSLQGLNMYSMSVIAKKYWLNKIYPQEIREAGANEDFHIHNLDLLACYCMGWDLLDLLQRGFGGVASKIECRPPKHFRTALGQTVNFLFTLQGESAGANAISNFDTLLAPFIRYDGLDYLQVKQSMQEFLYNCMVPTRVGFQTPFLNVTIDVKVPNFMRNTPVIIGGKPQNEVYGDFQKEMDMFNKAFYECMMEGDAKNRPFTFPIPTISITKDFDWENPQLDMMWEATAKYGINYFSNFIQSDMSPDDVKSMCLGANEEVVIKNSGNIKRLSIKEVAENYKIADFDADGWSDCRQDKELKVLSLNPKTLKTEWSPVKRFFRVDDFESVEITAEDGKKAEFSTKHPIPIFTPEGIQMKFSRDIKKGDYLLTLKKSGDSLSKNCQMVDDLVFNEKMAKIIGYFIADGNYLFKSGLTHREEGIRGMQFTFNSEDKENINLLKGLLEDTFGKEIKEKKDPRYNTYYLYLYD